MADSKREPVNVVNTQPMVSACVYHGGPLTNDPTLSRVRCILRRAPSRCPQAVTRTPLIVQLDPMGNAIGAMACSTASPHAVFVRRSGIDQHEPPLDAYHIVPPRPPFHP